MFSADLKSSYIMPSSVGNTPSAASAQSPAPASSSYLSTAGHHYNPKTPIGLVNNGVHINPNGRNLPTIFAAETAQVLSLPSRAGVTAARQNPHGTHRHEDREISASEKLFGGHGSSSLNTDTSSHELSRMQCVTMRQLQRALQNKIMQATRNASDLPRVFKKLDTRDCGHLNLYDLIRAVRGFNLVASDELVAQLLHAHDQDHDGLLSAVEFVTGLKGDTNHSSSAAVQLMEVPDYSVSSRRHFKSIRFNHPLHNAMHLAGDPRFSTNPKY